MPVVSREEGSNTHDRPLLLTVAVEDYFHGTALSGFVDRRQWSRFQTRVEQNTMATLDLLDRSGARATFFFMAWIAERHPDLVREVLRRGHEIASSGCTKRSFRDLSPDDFADELRRSRDILESVGGVKIHGFRVADHRLCPKDLWALRMLGRSGYSYDSSVNPSLRAFHTQPWRRFIHREDFDTGAFWEVPLSSLDLCGLHIPSAGGNWFRQMPEPLVKRAVQYWLSTCDAPFVMYFRVWDLDCDQPVITGAPRLSRLRHYRNPDKMPRLLESLLSGYSFSPIGRYLGLEQNAVAPAVPSTRIDVPPVATVTTRRRQPVTVVIPCYNEQSSIPYLANTLRDLLSAASAYNLRFLFVDDGSDDQTLDLIRDTFGAWPECRIVRHPTNSGVAAAILTGISESHTEVVCSMDCDCTYDPFELLAMIPKLVEGVDLVTASPYHPNGRVLHVPSWRLTLSKGASLLYRLVLRQNLYTYTSCFRVYRRTAVAGIHLEEHGFLGVAELLGRLDLNGSRIVEHPATLQVRMLGHSKMRVLRTIVGHIRLLARFSFDRLFRGPRPLTRLASNLCSPPLASKGLHRD